ncbi:MAG: type I restriction enzyme HsdR N-terminal domain-containing protein [Chloroflexi bacterium]|nr:type I restriction enzyme HsdR N-terminal domain-containing protein [Chloroflexota bacterium]
MLVIECKPASADLDQAHVSQLFQYFAASDAKFGLLTNGIVYRFYSDLDQRNKMDHRPFLELNLLDIEDASVEELKRFTKSAFDVNAAREAATDLKYTKEIKRILAEQFSAPSEDFVRLFVSQIYSGRMTPSVKDRFAQRIREALNQFINDRVDRVVGRAKSEMATGGDSAPTVPAMAVETILSEELPVDVEDSGIVTTDEEVQGFYIVKSLLHDVVDLKRIEMRDAKSFCAIHLDHTNRKPICRLWFNRGQKYLGLIDEQKREDRVPIDELDDIYQYADRLKATVRFYDQPPPQETSP